MARAGEEDLELHYTAEFRTHPPPQAAGTVYFAVDVDDVPAALGSRPDQLSEVRQEDLRRSVQQMVDAVPSLPTLNAPAPQMVEQLVHFSKFLGVHSPAEQVIDVPKISQDRTRQGLVEYLRQPQTAEQLVEVPTLFFFARECGAEHRHSSSSSSWRRSSRFTPGQVSTAFCGADHFENPLPRVGGLQGFLPRQASTASCAHSPGAADEAFTGFFALFPTLKKVRGWVRTQRRKCPRTRAHPRGELMACPWRSRRTSLSQRRSRSRSWRMRGKSTLGLTTAGILGCSFTR